MAQFPDKANVVIIGLGGIVGASVMHHLIERGWDDIVGIDMTSVPTTASSPATPRITVSSSTTASAITSVAAASRSRASVTTTA